MIVNNDVKFELARRKAQKKAEPITKKLIEAFNAGPAELEKALRDLQQPRESV